jgi:hypothetical protein
MCTTFTSPAPLHSCCLNPSHNKSELFVTYGRPGDDCREFGAVAVDQLLRQVLGISVRVGKFTYKSEKMAEF